ncbi:MAG: hypothetical protein J6Z43_03020 [Clostridiales bacterium]|nr:hypothetical protein [Clostridiales bacterium]
MGQWYNEPEDNKNKKRRKKPHGRPQGKPQQMPPKQQQHQQQRPKGKGPAGKHVKKTVNKPVNKHVNKPQGIKPEEKPVEKPVEKKQQAEISKITKQIEVKEEKQERKKKKTLDSHVKAERIAVRNGIFGAIAAAAALLVLAFVVYHLINYVAEKPRFSFVTDGAIEHTLGAKALIIREEEVVLSGTSGELVTSVTEGSRVAAAQNLAMVVPEDRQSTVTDLRNVQSQISDVQQELIEEGNVEAAKKVYESYNNNIEPIIDSIRFDSSTGKLQSLATYTSSLSVLLDERETSLSEIDFNDERLTVLRNDEQMYQSALQRSSATVKSPKPGIVSFRLDGQEGELTFDSVMNSERADVRRIINSSVGAMPANYSVKAQQSVCRIVQNEKQLFAVFLNAKDAAVTDFAVGTKHDINIATEGIVVENAEVVRCDSDNNGMLIVFQTTRFVENLLDLRTVDIEIVITKSTGMRVSVTSLVNEDLASSDVGGFSVFFPADTGVVADSFAQGSIFNINIIPNPSVDEEGNVTQPDSITISGCEVLHCEEGENGGVIVGFSTLNEYAQILNINSKLTDGYQAVFIDSSTGLGTNVDHVIASHYKGIASIYVNSKGFVAEHRVLITDYDREFAIIIPVANNKIPDHDTVIILNPTSCKPNDKVD